MHYGTSLDSIGNTTVTFGLALLSVVWTYWTNLKGIYARLVALNHQFLFNHWHTVTILVVLISLTDIVFSRISFELSELVPLPHVWGCSPRYSNWLYDFVVTVPQIAKRSTLIAFFLGWLTFSIFKFLQLHTS